mmetsp:Transcript_27683/g.43957  ORF Transcript_27683/g.43957 Transcript_27683/m.43957 type:complete len:235 (-) Transcript_27683:1475-2179(-)
MASKISSLLSNTAHYSIYQTPRSQRLWICFAHLASSHTSIPREQLQSPAGRGAVNPRLISNSARTLRRTLMPNLNPRRNQLTSFSSTQGSGCVVSSGRHGGIGCLTSSPRVNSRAPDPTVDSKSRSLDDSVAGIARGAGSLPLPKQISKNLPTEAEAVEVLSRWINPLIVPAIARETAQGAGPSSARRISRDANRVHYRPRRGGEGVGAQESALGVGVAVGAVRTCLRKAQTSP